jgi:uncharacterized protein YcfJ
LEQELGAAVPADRYTPADRHPTWGGMVAADWTALGQTALGAAAAIGGGFVGAWMQAQSQQHLEDQRRRERAAEVVASAFELYLSLIPVYLVETTTKENYSLLSRDLGRRYAELRV